MILAAFRSRLEAGAPRIVQDRAGFAGHVRDAGSVP
jgi:hypothetical protein